MTMTRRLFAAAVAVLTLLAVPASPAGATQHGPTTTLTVSLVPDLAAPVSCPEDSLFGFALGIVSLTGRPVGTGSTCVASVVGCDPFVAFCRRTVHATLDLELPRGSILTQVVLLEVLPSESSFIQFGHGSVVAGTGRFQHASGRVVGGGVASFDDQFVFSGQLIYVLVLHGVC